jgi:small neutral amino acid transporter SnatA (MarC family)
MRLHRGTLFAGAVYLMVAIVFMLEALDVWTLRIGDLRYIGPIALVLIGLAVAIGSLGRSDTQH